MKPDETPNQKNNKTDYFSPENASVKKSAKFSILTNRKNNRFIEL